MPAAPLNKIIPRNGSLGTALPGILFLCGEFCLIITSSPCFTMSNVSLTSPGTENRFDSIEKTPDPFVSTSDWDTICSEFDSRAWLLDPERLQQTKVFEGRCQLAARLQDWLRNGNVQIVPHWGIGNAGIRFGSGRLFGALALQLMMVAWQASSFLICCACGAMYKPGRLPRQNESNYCPPCREKGTAQNINSLRYYHQIGKQKRNLRRGKDTKPLKHTQND